MKTLIYLVALLVVCFLFVSCKTGDPQTVASSIEAFGTVLSSAVADSTVTEQELQQVSQAFQKLGGDLTVAFDQAGGVDWQTVLGTAAGAVVTTLTGIRLMPNSLIIGKQEADALNKSAGIS